MDNYEHPYNDYTEPIALTISTEDALYGRKLASAECSMRHEAEFGLGDYYISQPEEFLSALRCLPDEPAELLARYYLLGWSQEKIGHLLRVPQTKISKRIRAASRAITALIVYGGPPSHEALCRVLRPIGREFQICRAATSSKKKPMALPEVLAEYGVMHSYTDVAKKHGLDRIGVRRAIRSTAKLLDESNDREAAMVGAWLMVLVTRSSTEGTGYKRWGRATTPAA